MYDKRNENKEKESKVIKKLCIYQMKDIITLGIESSCDETSVAVVKNGREVLSNVINSQIKYMNNLVALFQKLLLETMLKQFLK